MAVSRIPPAGSQARFTAPAAAPVQPVAPAQTSEQEVPHHHHGSGHHHRGHPAGHGPTPRPRRNAAQKTSRTRRRQRASAGTPVDDDEIDFHEPAHGTDGISAVGFQDEHPDSGDDQGEGGEERSRHDRLGRLRRHAKEEDAAAAGSARGAGARVGGPAPARAAAAAAGAVVQTFVDAACAAVAGWRPGERTGLALQRAKLQMLLAAPDTPRLEDGGLARVVEHLRARMPAREGRGSATFNLLLPLLVLQMQHPRTPSQRDEAIARVQASIWSASR